MFVVFAVIKTKEDFEINISNINTIFNNRHTGFDILLNI